VLHPTGVETIRACRRDPRRLVDILRKADTLFTISSHSPEARIVRSFPQRSLAINPLQLPSRKDVCERLPPPAPDFDL
jgi:hypothetical protein